MVNFEQCPRCNNKWTISPETDIETCSNCKMSWLPKEEYFWLPFTEDFHLIWDMQDNSCTYVCDPIATEQIETKLPMLSFDISFEKLKLYLLFS